MAGDWIKWGKGFLRKPEIVGMADALNATRERVACAYMEVAEWLDSEGEPDDPGDVDSDITIEILLPDPSRKARDTCHALVSHLDEVARFFGFGRALIDVGWVELTDTAIVFKRAGRHNTETAKTRALASKRQQRRRAKKAAETSRADRDKCHARTVTRVEERREEDIDRTTYDLAPDSDDGENGEARDLLGQPLDNGKKPKPPPPDVRIFEAEFWPVVPRKVDKDKARAAFANARKRLSKQGMTPDEARAHLVERMKAFAASRKAKGEFCPYPATWLNGGRYDDDPSEWERTDGRTNQPYRNPGGRPAVKSIEA